MISLTKRQNKINIKIFEIFLVVTLLFSAFFITIYFDAKYNPDLRNSIKILEYMKSLTITESITENAFLFYLLEKLAVIFALSYTQILYLFYVFGQFILVFTLLKMFKPLIVLEIMLFTFFTILLNQIRFALSISILSYLIHLDVKQIKFSKTKKILFILSAIFFHLFAGAFYILFLINKKKPYITTIVIFSLIILVPLILNKLDDTRFLFYLNEESERGSFTFLFLFLILLFKFKYLKFNEKLFFTTMLTLVTITYSLASLSSRLSEISIVLLLLISSNKENPSSFSKIATLGVVVIFFLYRSILWFVLGAVPEPV